MESAQQPQQGSRKTRVFGVLAAIMLGVSLAVVSHNNTASNVVADLGNYGDDTYNYNMSAMYSSEGAPLTKPPLRA